METTSHKTEVSIALVIQLLTIKPGAYLQVPWISDMQETRIQSDRRKHPAIGDGWVGRMELKPLQRGLERPNISQIRFKRKWTCF